MTWPNLILSSGLSIIALFVAYGSLERLFWAKDQPVFRPAWFLDLCFLLGQYLVWSGLVLWVLLHFQEQLNCIVSPTFRAGVTSQPWWLQAVEMVVISSTVL